MKKRLLAIFLVIVLLLPAALSAAETASLITAQRASSVSRAAKPSKITITGKKTVEVGKKITLKASVSPSAASQKVTWTSSNKSVATVSKTGVVKGVKPGTAKITATSKANKKVKKTFTVTVKAAKHYYALLIGNGQGYPYGSQLNGPPNDVKAMKAALKGLKQNWKITVKNDLTADQIRAAIHSAFDRSTVNDVCLFYYSGHGSTGKITYYGYWFGDTDDQNAGALIGVDQMGFNGQNLAYHLNSAVKGKAIILLDSCGSGGLIKKADGTTEPVDPEKEATRFVDSMISSFSYFDSVSRDADKTGELRNGKFVVLAACEYLETSADTTSDGITWGGAFTQGLLNAMGCSHPSGRYGGSMPADTNHNKKLTLKETFSGIRKYTNGRWSQKVQKYGKNSFVLFER